MSTTVQNFLTAFDALPATERDAVVTELILRCPVGERDLPDSAFDELAEELFLSYDVEEAEDAASPTS